jgi:hypothetical protein
MKETARRFSKCSLVLGVIAVAAAAASSLAQDLRPSDCLPGIQCLDVWNPVICDNGQVYSNLCYARKACATGCVPY